MMHPPSQQQKRRLNNNSKGGGSGGGVGGGVRSLSLLIVYGLIGMMFFYVTMMVYLSSMTNMNTTTTNVNNNNSGMRGGKSGDVSNNNNNDRPPFGRRYSREEWSDVIIDANNAIAKTKKKAPFGQGVIQPELLIGIDPDKRDPKNLNRHHDMDPADQANDPPPVVHDPHHALIHLDDRDPKNMNRHHDMDPADQANNPPPLVVTAAAAAAAGGGAAAATANQKKQKQQQQQQPLPPPPPGPHRILTAYLEPVDQTSWLEKPLPVRTWTKDDLTAVPFPRVNSCTRLPEQFPVDDYPGEETDPFLPWIHDVFPTDDGKFIMFIAQNKRRCKTGTTPDEVAYTQHMSPQIALFQHVAVTRMKKNNKNNNNYNNNNQDATAKEETRYRLSSHEDADPDGMDTRFICQFQPTGQETLSVYNVNYEWASYRKNHKKMFSVDGHRDGKFIHTSQLIFKCPVPDNLVETIRTGASVIDDYATLFVNVIPIRTPPRFHRPNAFFPPYYSEFLYTEREADDDFGLFDPIMEWGTNHVLPRIVDAGRWENIPICKPSLMTYGPPAEPLLDAKSVAVEVVVEASPISTPIKKHKLVSCLWASTGYATRGNRFAINDGQRRLLEWITYNKLIGFDHFYLYDNSGAFNTGDSTN
jgi:hypothetical protein